MTTKREGYDGAGSTPVGAVVEKVWWEVPGHYGVPVDGVQHSSELAAIKAGLGYYRELNVKYAEAGRGPITTGFSVDVRWKMSYPEGGGVETTMHRTTYGTLTEADEHVQRIQRYHPHEPCTDPGCPRHGIAASNARQSAFYAANPRTEATS